MTRSCLAVRQFCAASLIAFLTWSNAHADDGDLVFMALNGLDSVALELSGMRRDFARFGLTENYILEAMSNALTSNGIRVIDATELPDHDDAALMRIRINANENQFRFYFYGISIELKKKIPLNNAAGGYISGTIWKKGQTGIVMPTDLRNVRGIVLGLLKDFMSDHRSQNPLSLSEAESP